MSSPVIKNLVENRKARFDYFLEDQVEAGIELLGSEVKSLRAGQGNLQDAHVRIDRDGAWLVGFHIAAYDQANRNNHEPLRVRRLLMHQREIDKFKKNTRERGKTVIPVRVYLKGAWVKVEIAVGKGKKAYDKRQTLKARTADDEMHRRRRR